MPEFAFDIRLNAVARTRADTEEQARARLEALDDEFEIDYSTDGEGSPEEVWITAASLAHPAEAARIFEPHDEDDAMPAGVASPLYQAGYDGYRPVLDLTKAMGFTRYADALGANHTDVSPDGQLAVEFGPEADAPHIAPLWRIARRDPDPYRTDRHFAAYFDGGVPAEAIAAFLSALTAPSPRPVGLP